MKTLTAAVCIAFLAMSSSAFAADPVKPAAEKAMAKAGDKAASAAADKKDAAKPAKKEKKGGC